MIAKVLGVDFDNTIVCYDEIFYRVATERKLIPADLSKTKEQVRDYLRRVGCEDDWTEMQGYVYGSRMADVKPFPGAIECMTAAVKAGVSVAIISHKTRTPYLGHPYDLHSAARGWIQQQGFFDPDRIGMKETQVFFLETKQMKLEQISRCGCRWFIDDLPEFFLEGDFPDNVERLLFDPANSFSEDQTTTIRRFDSWADIGNYLEVL
ncbi:MAG: hypothetical protein WCW53_06280 [Syntrophales bacterium]|jgi:hypothetical protein